MTTIRTDTNLVEVVTIRTKPDVDPDEPLLGELWIWEHDGQVDYTFTPTNSNQQGATAATN